MVSFIGTCPMAINLPQGIHLALQEGNERMRRELNRDENAVTRYRIHYRTDRIRAHTPSFSLFNGLPNRNRSGQQR